MRCLFVFVFLFTTSFFSYISASGDFSQNCFVVRYANNTPDSVKLVIDKITETWSSIIKSDVSINVEVQWIQMVGTTQSGCSPTMFFSNFKGASIKNVMYPVPLAEKLCRSDLNNPGEADILLKINNKPLNTSWYYGLDGKPSKTQQDLFTVLLHEFAHGLGIVTNYTMNGDFIGSKSGLPTIFDTFIVDASGIIFLSDTSFYRNNSNQLKKAILSQKLFFKGPFTQLMNSGAPVRLYAPSEYVVGSSISHLDENYYPIGDINSLMTPMFAQTEVVHSIGPICKGILADMGWSEGILSTSVFDDREDISSPVIIEVNADSVFDNSQLELHYSYDNFEHQLALTLQPTSSLPKRYSVQVPNFAFNHKISYYITAQFPGQLNSTVGIPANFPKNYYSFNIGIDTIKPVITHVKVVSISTDIDSLLIFSSVVDNLGVDSVWVEYSINSNPLVKPNKKTLQRIYKNSYATYLPLNGKLVANTYFFYRIYAVDKSKRRNISATNESEKGFYEYIVTQPSKILNSFSENFNNQDEAVKRFFLDGMTVGTPKGFSSPALNSSHPYNNSLSDGLYANITAMIANPIHLRNTDATLSFDEICLLEPGNPGTVFGDYEFWDYCIVEGSINKIDWYAFEKVGYKTEVHKEWLERYWSQTIVDKGKTNSIATASEDLYRRHEINLLKNKYIRRGDNVYIRFRMMTDAFVYGWGWVIDNIEIQTTAVNDNQIAKAESRDSFCVLCRDNFTIKTNEDVYQIKCYNTSGSEFSLSYRQIGDKYYEIQCPGFAGMYYMSIVMENGDISTGKVIVTY